MQKHFLVALFLFAISQNIFSQGDKYKNYKYDWPAGKPPEIKVDDSFKNEDAVILEEKTAITLWTGVISKTVRIKFLKEEGIKKFGTIVLPESYDELTDQNDLPFWKKDTAHRPVGEFNSLIYFAPRIIKPDGKIIPAEYSENVRQENKEYNSIKETFYTWYMTIQRLQPSDELEVAYSYTNIYKFNNFFNRVFFHGIIAKQNCEVKIRYPNIYHFFFQNHNGAAPVDSGEYKGTSPHSLEYTWRLTNLPACANEKNSRPYKELPYVTFYRNYEDFGIAAKNMAYIETYLPYTWEFVLLGNNDFNTQRRPGDGTQKFNAPGFVKYNPQSIKYMLSKTDPETRAVANFVDDNTKNTTDTSYTYKFSLLHKIITDSFDYVPDYNPIASYYPDVSSVNKAISKKSLKEIDRFDFYDRMAMALRSEYYHARLMDKRYGEMNLFEYSPYRVYNIYYALPYKNSYLFFFPKKSRFGYYGNELPFYYEDIRTILIPRSVDYEEQFNIKRDIPYKQLTTPYSTDTDNSRITTVLCSVNLTSKTVDFDTRLNLSGQFSTLTRGFYLYGDMDSTLTANYYQPVYALSRSSKIISKEMTSHKTIFPYESNFRIKYADASVLKSTSGNQFTLSLQNWFNNIYDKNLETKNRVMFYYPDFQYSDQHRYMIKFDKPVSINNIADYTYTEENSFGKYTISLKQIDDTSYMLETMLHVTAGKVAPYNITDVSKIFTKIDWLNNSSLQGSIKN